MGKTKDRYSQGVWLSKEAREIKKAFKNVERIKAGKLKGRPAEELLNGL